MEPEVSLSSRAFLAVRVMMLSVAASSRGGRRWRLGGIFGGIPWDHGRRFGIPVDIRDKVNCRGRGAYDECRSE